MGYSFRRPNDRHYNVDYLYEPENENSPALLFYVEYSVSRIHPAMGPSWNDPGCPQEGGEISIQSITPPPGNLESIITKWVEDNHDNSEDY